MKIQRAREEWNYPAVIDEWAEKEKLLMKWMNKVKHTLVNAQTLSICFQNQIQLQLI